jgi:hypothetical protein
MADILLDKSSVNTESHSQMHYMFCMLVGSRMESIHNCYKTRSVFVLSKSYYKIFIFFIKKIYSWEKIKI